MSRLMQWSDGKRTYLRAATEEFCRGTRCRAAHEVVELGIKSIQEWCFVLTDKRDEFKVPDTRGAKTTITDPDTRYAGLER